MVQEPRGQNPPEMRLRRTPNGHPPDDIDRDSNDLTTPDVSASGGAR